MHTEAVGHKCRNRQNDRDEKYIDEKTGPVMGRGTDWQMDKAEQVVLGGKWR